MGLTLRRYWMPALLSSELPHADGDPLRVRLLGEDLVAFRDSNGSVGLIQNNCPHRGASLFFGRNEEGGIRCVNHGWKFDVSGQCLDMPNLRSAALHEAGLRSAALHEAGLRSAALHEAGLRCAALQDAGEPTEPDFRHKVKELA